MTTVVPCIAFFFFLASPSSTRAIWSTLQRFHFGSRQQATQPNAKQVCLRVGTPLTLVFQHCPNSPSPIPSPFHPNCQSTAAPSCPLPSFDRSFLSRYEGEGARSPVPVCLCLCVCACVSVPVCLCLCLGESTAPQSPRTKPLFLLHPHPDSFAHLHSLFLYSCVFLPFFLLPHTPFFPPPPPSFSPFFLLPAASVVLKGGCFQRAAEVC